jgi:hypothetical protein
MVLSKRSKQRRLALTVIAMGWVLAVEVCQHLHRNLLRRCGELPSRVEIRRDRPFPIGASAKFLAAWKVYIDDFKHAKIFTAEEITALEDQAPELFLQALAEYEMAGAEGNPKKEEVNKVAITSLGERMDGIRGDRRAPLGYEMDLIDLTLLGLSSARPKKKLVQIILGR